MKISTRIVCNITEDLVNEFFPNSIPTVGELLDTIEILETILEILETILEDFPEWEDEFADYWSD